MRRTFAAVAAVLAGAGAASAQTLEYRPIDTNQLVVQPADAATGILSGTARYVSRVVAGVIDDNGVVRTLNNLLGREAEGPPVQAGFSRLPAPGTYPSTKYRSTLTPAMPTSHTFGRTPGGR